MSRVDFHILENPQPEQALRYACRLINKAYMQGHRLYVRVADAGNAEQLDRMLWAFSDLAFVPHRIEGSGDATPVPVNIGIMGEASEADAILVNLCSDMPGRYARHERVIEIVAGDAEATKAARSRYRQYREHGDVLNTHKISS